MPGIIGRQAEQAVLNKLYKQSNAVFLALYGRRRVGKTYLIDEFFRDKGIFFELTGSKKASKKEQLRNFFHEFLTLFPQNQTKAAPEDWGEAFHYLHQAIETIDQQQKIIIFLDELPWLAAPRSGFLGALEYIWNRHFSRRKNLILIVCGSAASWMIKKVINNKAGLYGRLTLSLPLYPFNLREMEQFLKAKHVELDRKQIVELFMVTGGIGAYLNHIVPGQSVAQNINQLCFRPSAPLFLEFNNLFQSLFSHSEKHLSIIKALAMKRRGLTQKALLKAANLPASGRTTEVLDELSTCGFIAALPTFGKVLKERKFRLVDEYSYFYLSWIQPVYLAILRGSNTEYWQQIFTSSSWLSWAGYAFENTCLKHIIKIKQALGIAAVNTTAAYWQYIPKKNSEETGAEIDLIIDRADGCINLCEIKFCNAEFKIDKAYAKNLLNKKEVFREKTGTKKSLFTTLITPFGTIENSHYQSTVQNQITLDDLF